MMFNSPSSYLLLIVSVLFLMPVLCFIKKNKLKAWLNVVGWLTVVGGLLLIYSQFSTYGPVALMAGLSLVLAGGLVACYDHAIDFENGRSLTLAAKECINIDQVKISSANETSLWMDEELIGKS
ncbi:hypothetical protein [Malonomonas rubra]|uniref:hypothetical protein n=1 Tax=Malonomonas rubra TaxID=57040 RepID=UPI0026ECBD48|nr:hypothetical protein [Malonomonas rubra]